MALDDLSLVTNSLMTLLEESVKLRYPAIKVVPQSPDKLPDTTKNTLCLYLYHAREEAHYKNATARDGSSSVERTPLSLCLYYILTAHDYDDGEEAPNVLTEQKLMGYGLKAMHDFPIITDGTKVGETIVLHGELLGKDNKLQIIYRPVAPEEAATFWGGDDQRLIRFSAFYEVRVVQLAPEPVVQLPGYVLSVGSYILPTGAIHIASTHGVVRFTPPGGAEVALNSSPARVAIRSADMPGPQPQPNQLQLRGTRLGGGRLVLRSPLFETTNNQIVVDPALNPEWQIQVTGTQLTARVQNDIKLPGGVTQDVLPGTYGVSVQVSAVYPLPGGQSKTITTRSNEWAIAFTPFVEQHTPVLGQSPVVRVITAIDTVLTDSALDQEIEVFVAGQAYALNNVAPGPKEFRFLDGKTIEIHTHFGEDDIGVYPFRLVVRGAEAPPFWIEVVEP